MEESREFETVEGMKQYIVEQHASLFNEPPFTFDDIVIREESVEDPRIGWKDTRCVCVKRFLSKDFIKMCGAPQCIGFCATTIRNEPG